MQRNRLAAETSPYLLQHADNPVDWYPWGPEALAAAEHEHKPILLSVGYSACHWCHVMAHESFEDPVTAALMNRLFVNVKVDREERPDIDKIYQTAQQLITQHAGGWPLTMFLTPRTQAPFFGGTYFPKEARHGLPAFSTVLQRVAAYFKEHAGAIEAQNAELVLAFDRLTASAPPPDLVLDDTLLARARQAVGHSFDPRFGGFGQAPKFPDTASIDRCLRGWYATSHLRDPDLQALYMATLTLTRMAEGGIFDQLGGGFCRYSVDDQWLIPHFEKMLYDNGQLLATYAQASLATGEALYRRIAAETAGWILREMRSPEGGFYSSLDADSEGHEGRFYVWSRDEILGLTTAEEYRVLAQHFGLDGAPNFEGRWHLHVAQPLESIAADSSGAQVPATLDAARAKLLAARERRIRPSRDEKVLTSWNALAIKGLALAGRHLQRPDFTAAASTAVDFIRNALWRDGRLWAGYKDGRANLPAYLDDYAFLADALLELLQSRWRSSDLEFARELVDVLLDQFEDGKDGGFYFTGAAHERLFYRTKTFNDEATPSGNGIAASVLCRLGYLLGDIRYLEAAERTLRAAYTALREHPRSHMSLLNALEDFLVSTQLLIVRGDADEVQRWARELGVVYGPTRMLFAIPRDVVDLPPALADKRAGVGTTAYVCNGMTCSAPITDLGELVRHVSSRLTG